MISIFTDTSIQPDEQELQKALNNTYPLWNAIKEYTLKKAPAATQQWKHSGTKFGWGFRISDKKRVLVYLLPREGFFRVAMIFGQKAVDALIAADIADNIKTELLAARPFAEGRGIRLEVKGLCVLEDIRQLIDIKISN